MLVLLVSRGARVRTGAGAKAIVPSLGAVKSAGELGGIGSVWATAATLGS